VQGVELRAFLGAMSVNEPLPGKRIPPVTPLIGQEDLATAIREDQFEMHYQPQMDLTTGKLVGVEALVRWRHPQLGLVYPNAFIRLAEETGQIDALSWVTYARAVSEFRTLCGGDYALELSLNLSASSLHDLGIPEKLIEIARDTGVPLSCLVLEVTETGLMRELSSALDILTRLRMKGMGLSIDDFGTGYSAMDQLRLVPATELKIDRSFVNEFTRNENALVLVEKTIEIGRRLNMRVVAEGVETEEQLRLLRKLECEVAQGYLFSRPLPMPALIRWISELPGGRRRGATRSAAQSGSAQPGTVQS
jgi:EAL domain-containing protein (putative c-di-GMP-specific phosphodiesterase class I)